MTAAAAFEWQTNKERVKWCVRPMGSSCVRHRPDDNHRSCQIHKDKNTNVGGFNGDNVRLMTATALSKGGWAGLKVALRPIRRVIWAGGSPSDFRWWQLRSPSDNHGLLKSEVTVRLWLLVKTTGILKTTTWVSLVDTGGGTRPIPKRPANYSKT